MDYLETRELYHHGIKGQKWGVRRYQYEDGTLTAEGRKRYGKGLSNSYQNRVNARYDKKISKIESQRAKDNNYYDKNPNANTLWDPETGKTMKDWGNEYYDSRVNRLNAKREKKLDPERAERRKQALKKAAIAATAVAVTALAAYGVKKLKDSKIVEDGASFAKQENLNAVWKAKVADRAKDLVYERDLDKNLKKDPGYWFQEMINQVDRGKEHGVDVLPAKPEVLSKQAAKVAKNAKLLEEAMKPNRPRESKDHFLANPYWVNLAKDLGMRVEELYELRKG